MAIDHEQAIQKFEDIKHELYEILQIEELENIERSDEEMEEEKRILLKRIHSS